MKLGTIIRNARYERCLSLQGLATVCGADASTLSRIERNSPARRPSAKLLERLATVLKLDRDSLFVAAGRIPDDLTKYLLKTPGALARVRREANL